MCVADFPVRTGDICVNVLKRDWTSDTTIRHVLMVVRCLLIQPFPDSALNEEAGRLILEDFEQYEKHGEQRNNLVGIGGSWHHACQQPLHERHSAPFRARCTHVLEQHGTGPHKPSCLPFVICCCSTPHDQHTRPAQTHHAPDSKWSKCGCIGRPGGG